MSSVSAGMNAKGKSAKQEPDYIQEPDCIDDQIDDGYFADNQPFSGDEQCDASIPARPTSNVELPGINADVAEHVVNVDIVKSMVFDCWEEAESFYCSYSKQLGFGVRRRDCRKSVTGKVLMYKWVCSKQGVRHHSYVNNPDRKRQPRAETREWCKAMFQVNHNSNAGNFYVRHFTADHNHDLVHPSHVQFIPTHRCVRDTDQMDVSALRRVGVKTSQIVDYIALQSGGYGNMGFTRKDMYNHIDKKRMQLVHEGDAKSTLGYFAGLKRGDPSFFYEYSLDSAHRLIRLFWSDLTCQLDYRCFGDVVAFDATYKRNVYHFPLVMLIGVNHHHQTIVFGCALLDTETSDAYSWLLNSFLRCMCMKCPVSVLTDGDKAMRAAINKIMPHAKHRLCAWHLERNALSEMKDPRFLGDFKRLLFDRRDVDDFEQRWANLIDAYNLHDNTWASRLYDSRHSWAETYLMGYFFGGLRTTSRCEAMHSFINHFVNRKLKLFEFVGHYERALSRIRYLETEADHKSLYSRPVCVHALRIYEIHAAEVYTARSFHVFQRELYKEVAYLLSGNVLIEGDSEVYNMCKWNSRTRITKVVFNRNTSIMKCACLMLESCGFPCRHLLAVCKIAGLACVPPDFIWPRWSKQAKASLGVHIDRPGLTDQMVKKFRYGSATTKCRSICQLASTSDEAFLLFNNEILRLGDTLQQLQQNSMHKLANQPYAEVRDPDMKPKKPTTNIQHKRKYSARRCGNCREVGHIKTNCPHQSVDVASPIRISPIICDNEILGDLDVGDGSEAGLMDTHTATSSQPTSSQPSQWESHASLSDDGLGSMGASLNVE